ncbi:MAG: hypothetical protein H6735_23010 [Alphaproteobacteria bacterium]|nr:hypothetical protein [Alphaproteobacteria bacterium]
MNEARLNVTWNGQNGDLADLVPADATDAEVLAWATEAVRSGAVGGVAPDARVDLTGFVVDRFPATADLPFPRLFVRPKTPFGAA